MAEQLEQITELDERIETDEVDEGKRLWRGIVALVVLCVLVGALLTAVPCLRAVADRLSGVNPWWIVLAVVLELGSCLGYVLAFQHVFYRAPPVFAARVALSEMAFSAVIPAGGAGGIALGAYIVTLWVRRGAGGRGGARVPRDRAVDPDAARHDRVPARAAHVRRAAGAT